MSYFKISTAFLILISTQLISCARNDSSPVFLVKTELSGNIRNGKPVVNNSAISSHLVIVYDELKDYQCTGILYAEGLILTAAHCVPKNRSKLFIIFNPGFVDWQPNENTIKSKVDRVAVSPKWGQNIEDKDVGDIALVHYQGITPADLKPATFLEKVALLKDGTDVHIAGYGIKDKSMDGSWWLLRSTQLKIMTALFGDTEVKLDQRYNTGACYGDSGGPAYIYDVASATYLVWGVASRISDDSDKEICVGTSVYTKVSAYSQWLQQAADSLRTAAPSR